MTHNYWSHPGMDAELGEPSGFTPTMSLALLRDQVERDEAMRQVEEFR